MNAIIPFAFEGAAVRVVDRDGAPWMFHADACRVLGIRNPSQAATRLDDDEKAVISNEGIAAAQVQTLMLISEAGLYRLTMGSRKPQAKRFQKWVTSEVLPTIRRTGSYGAPKPLDLDDAVSLRQRLLDYTEGAMALKAEVAQLTADNAELLPKADALDRIATADGSKCITDAAKALQIRRMDLTALLHELGWIFCRPGTTTILASQARLNSGLLEHKESPYTKRDGSIGYSTQVRVKRKGLTRLAEILAERDAKKVAVLAIAAE